MGKELLGGVSSTGIMKLSDSFYSCLDCHACLYVCPAGVNAGKVSHLSRQLIVSESEENQHNPFARMIVSVTKKKMNPLGVMKKSSGWARGIAFDDESQTLLYTGNMYQLMSYTSKLNSTRRILGKRISAFMAGFVARHPGFSFLLSLRNDRTQEKIFSDSLRNIVALLKKAGVSFSYMGMEEPYPGTFIYDLGYIDDFREYAEKVADAFRARKLKRIITTDPHTYELLKRTYPVYVNNFDFDVIYYLDLLDKVEFDKTNDSVVYHEPCHFVLRDQKYDVPYNILRNISDLRLPRRSGRRNECCGGPSELLFPEIAEDVSKRRHEDLTSTGASTIVTSCPICFANLDRGSKIMDIADFLSEKAS